MNRQREIDRVLDAWFVDGSSGMPDRLFEAVLDQIERVPQRRRPWTNLRVPPMTPRLAAAAVIALVVGTVGFGLLGQPPDPGAVDRTQSPLPSTPVGPDLAVPEVLRYHFHGALPLEPAAPSGQDRAVIRLGAQSFDYNRVQLQSSASAPAPDRIRVVSLRQAGGCAVGDEGTYTWSATPGGTRVTFRLVEDACAARAAVIPGEWLRSVCTDPYAFCPGPLEAGRYSSFSFDPFVRHDGPWRPRSGALTYVLPDEWTILYDQEGEYALAPNGAPEGSGIFLRSDASVTADVDQCRDAPRVGLRPTDMVAWLARADGVVASDPIQATIGGLSGWVLDVETDAEWTTTCPIGGEPLQLPTTGPGPRRPPWSLGPDTRVRLYLLDVDGRMLLVSIEASDPATHEALLDEATAIVESFEFAFPPDR